VWTRKPLGELHIPRTVEDAVRSRARTLGGEERRLLELAAVMGRRFDVDVLGEVVQQDEAQLLELLKVLIDAQLLVEESTEHFSFRHALTREAIYAELLARARRPLHRAIGEVIERRFAGRTDTYAADLAYHFYEGGVWAKALSYARRAGERAQTLFAWRAAIEHFTRAIHAADCLGADAPADLYLARGQASDLLGDFDNAREDYERAHAIANASGELRIARTRLHAGRELPPARAGHGARTRRPGAAGPQPEPCRQCIRQY
jgi:predicted ATPase